MASLQKRTILPLHWQPSKGKEVEMARVEKLRRSLGPTVALRVHCTPSPLSKRQTVASHRASERASWSGEPAELDGEREREGGIGHGWLPEEKEGSFLRRIFISNAAAPEGSW